MIITISSGEKGFKVHEDGSKNSSYFTHYIDAMMEVNKMFESEIERVEEDKEE